MEKPRKKELLDCPFCGETPEEIICFGKKCIEHSNNPKCPMRKNVITIESWNTRKEKE